jgi:hypothetical protein
MNDYEAPIKGERLSSPWAKPAKAARPVKEQRPATVASDDNWIKTFWKYSWGLSAFFFMLSLTHQNNVLCDLLCGFFLVLPPIGTVFIMGMQGLHQAMEPIPEPVQIEAQLRAEGYNPSLSDVMAVRQMFVQRRNEGLLVAGIGFGGLYLAHREMHGGL